jgi:Rrf2 family nitric oxide-sensitive transcriptional repressor
VLQQLARAGVIASRRGAGGGFRLARPALQISVYDAVQPVDPVRRILECPLGLDAHERQLCPLHKKLDEAAEFLERQFRETPITQLIESPQALAEVSRRVADASCHFPLEPTGAQPTAE